MSIPSRAKSGLGRFLAGLGLAGMLALASCGLAESIAEDFVDDQDYELYVDGGGMGTLVRAADGTDVGVELRELHPGDVADNHQALGVFGFGFDRGLQPDKTDLEWIRLRVWVQRADGDVGPLGSLIVSHLPPGSEGALAAGTVPHPPGADLATIADTTSAGWREVDVTQAFLQDWHSGGSVSAFVIRFSTPTDDGNDDDNVDLNPEVGGEVLRAHLVLHFGINL